MCLVRVFNFVKKADHQYEITIFKSGERILPLVAHPFPLPIYPFYSLSRKPNPCTPHLHQRLRTSTAGLHVHHISSPPSAFQDPARDRAFVAADPSLQDLGSNLTVYLGLGREEMRERLKKS